MLTPSGDGVPLWWQVVGEGPAVVLIPGRGDSTDLYPRCFTDRLLAAGYSLLRFDPRDTGRSGDGGDAYTLSTMADDVVTVLDAAGVETAHAVGWSMGGIILVELADRFAERVGSTVLLAAMSPDPAGGMGPDFFAALGGDPVETALAAMGAPAAADRRWIETEFERAALRAARRPEAGRRHQDAAMRFGWPTLDTLARIRVPTLVIHGGADRVLPLAHAHAFVRGVAGADLHIIETAGHMFTRSEWDVIGSLVLAHLAKIS